MKDTIPHLYSQLASVEIHLRPFPHHGLSRDHVVRHPRYNLRNTPSELCDFHSQSQGMCWYFRTALETLSTQIRGRVISLPREIELLDSFGVRIWQWIYVAFIIWHPGIWQHDRNHIVATNAQNNYILFEFCPSITNESWTDMHAESTQNRKLAGLW